MKIGFSENYKVVDVEFRKPFSFPEGEELFWRDVSLFRSTLFSVHDVLKGLGLEINEIDVGFDAPEIGMSFFSSDYNGILNVSLDAIVVSLHDKNSIFP